jgi:DNA invertase Pin-like site-specific DNA recombinase
MGIGRKRPSIKPDLFSALQPSDTPSPLASDQKTSSLRTDEPAATASPSYALPINLPSALRHLDDNQLDRLLAAVLAERQTRGRKKQSVSDEPRRKKRSKEVALPLAQGKLNAVRAAFKAGVRPSRIAREFGISQSDVRKALVSDEKTR